MCRVFDTIKMPTRDATPRWACRLTQMSPKDFTPKDFTHE